MALIMEKASLRTRVTFEVGMGSLGGRPCFSIRRCRRWASAKRFPTWRAIFRAGCRASWRASTSSASWSCWRSTPTIPVINALSDRYHPCQALADFFTLEEHFGSVRGLKLAYVGDGNNVCHSLLIAGARLGADMRVATPAGYEPKAEIVAEAQAHRARNRRQD